MRTPPSSTQHHRRGADGKGQRGRPGAAGRHDRRAVMRGAIAIVERIGLVEAGDDALDAGRAMRPAAAPDWACPTSASAASGPARRYGPNGNGSGTGASTRPVGMPISVRLRAPPSPASTTNSRLPAMIEGARSGAARDRAAVSRCRTARRAGHRAGRWWHRARRDHWRRAPASAVAICGWNSLNPPMVTPAIASGDSRDPGGCAHPVPHVPAPVAGVVGQHSRWIWHYQCRNIAMAVRNC